MVFLLTISCIGSISITFGQADVEPVINIQTESLPPLNFTYVIGSDCKTVSFMSTGITGYSNWTWDFTNDGIVDTWGHPSVSFTYPHSGIFVVKHCAEDKLGWGCVTKEIRIGQPVADFEWESDNLVVTFTDKSTVCHGDITFRGWDFTDDGGFDDYGENVIHEYPDPGTYCVRLIVQSGYGESSIRKNVAVYCAIPDLVCHGSFIWSDVKPNTAATVNFTVYNLGDSDSKLDWKIESYPTWGSWEFTPQSGDDLTPEDEAQTVEVKVIAPDEKNSEFTGEIKVVNKNDYSDYETIQISLTTSKNKSFINQLLFRSYEQHLYMFPLLRQLLRL